MTGTKRPHSRKKMARAVRRTWPRPSRKMRGSGSMARQFVAVPVPVSVGVVCAVEAVLSGPVESLV